jgi:hypothetical protein
MNREFRNRDADRPALLGDRDHTDRIARRTAVAAFIGMLLVLAPLVYGLARDGRGRFGQFSAMEAVLIGGVVLLAAAAAAFAAMVVVHLLGREARARRRR